RSDLPVFRLAELEHRHFIFPRRKLAGSAHSDQRGYALARASRGRRTPARSRAPVSEQRSSLPIDGDRVGKVGVVQACRSYRHSSAGALRTPRPTTRRPLSLAVRTQPRPDLACPSINAGDGADITVADATSVWWWRPYVTALAENTFPLLRENS